MTGIEGKVIVITGASSGIGEATARLLAERGAKVVLGARRTERLESLVSELRANGLTAAFRATDVTRLEDVQQLTQYALAKYGRLDVFVNNAGIMPLSPLDRLKIDEWNRTIDVNIRGVLHGIAAALPVMKKQRGGQFVNVSSVAGHQVWPMCAVYCATKFAVQAISDGLRQEHTDIRVSVIAPGVTESELGETIKDEKARTMIEGFRAAMIPADAIARAIAFAIDQPAEVDVSEIIVRPTASPY